MLATDANALIYQVPGGMLSNLLSQDVYKRQVYIKSVMLLPKYEEEAEELKKELSGQLLEYEIGRAHV